MKASGNVIIALVKAFVSIHEISQLEKGLSPMAEIKERLKAEKILSRLGFMRVRGADSRLNEEEWQTLSEGLTRDASDVERKKAEKILRQSGGFQPKARPGRKKEFTTNDVDVELRWLIGTICSIMSVPASLPKLRTLGLLRQVI